MIGAPKQPTITFKMRIPRALSTAARVARIHAMIKKTVNETIFDREKPGIIILNVKSFLNQPKQYYELHFHIYVTPKDCWQYVMVPGIKDLVLNIDDTRKAFDPENKLRGLTHEEAFCFG